MSHPCRNYCSQWNGEQCKSCTISDEVELQDPPAVEYCPHGYDAGCLICGFGTKDGKRVWHNKKTIAEVSIRTNESDFAVGDLVVVINPRATKNIFEVEALTHEGVFANECTAVFIMRHFFTFDLIRLATPAEKAAGRRIDDPLISDEMASPCAVSDLAENNNKIDLVSRKDCQVCIEEETPELFNSKHCSPRNYNNDSALRVSEIKASVAYSKMALTNFTLSEKNSRLKTNNHALKAALAMSIVVGVVGWLL